MTLGNLIGGFIMYITADKKFREEFEKKLKDSKK